MMDDYRHPAVIRRALRGLVPIVCPPDVAELGLEGAIVDEVELAMAAIEPPVRLALLAGIMTYELGGLAFGGRPASRLSRTRAARYFALWWSSPLGLQRELAKGVKGLLCLACYEQPAMMARIDYTPQAWIDKVKKRRLAVHAADIHRAAAALIEPDPLPGVVAPRRRAVEVGR
jgi:hypothetical protein